MAGTDRSDQALHRRDMMKLLAASGAAIACMGAGAQAAAPNSILVVADQQPTSLDPITGTMAMSQAPREPRLAPFSEWTTRQLPHPFFQWQRQLEANE